MAKKKRVSPKRPSAAPTKKSARTAKKSTKAKKPAPKSTSSESPGWDAIDAALDPIYGSEEPEHFGTIIPYYLGGPDPLTGISVYYRAQPTPHFHYVTYGFSDLFGTGKKGAKISQYGFELTFRLAAKKKSKSPSWPLNFLNNIARYVFETGNTFDDGHHVDLNGPIAIEEKTDICYIAFAHDPELPARDSPFGHLKFLQIVGLVQDEYELTKRWQTQRLLEFLRQKSPLLITDLKRSSILADKNLASQINSLAEAEGSSMNQVMINVAEFKRSKDSVQIKLGARAISELKAMLTGQVAKGESCALFGPEQGISFEPGKKDGWTAKKDLLTIKISPALLKEMQATLKPQRGVYTWPALPKLKLEIVPTEITDADGKVLKTIG